MVDYTWCHSSRVSVIVFKATFNNISVISWLSVLLVEETMVSCENHRPTAIHLQTVSHNVVHLAMSGIQTHISGDRHSSRWTGYNLILHGELSTWSYIIVVWVQPHTSWWTEHALHQCELESSSWWTTSGWTGCNSLPQGELGVIHYLKVNWV